MRWLLAILMVVAMTACRQQPHYDVDRDSFPVKGIDISAHNGAIDFAKVAADSISFVIIKATEGTDFCDAMFARNYEGAKQAGLLVGAYHFFRFDSPGHIQAYHFLKAIEGKDIDLPLAIDVEDWTNSADVPAEEVVAQLASMVAVIKAADYPVMIYTNKNGYDSYIRGNFEPADVDLWYSSMAGVPSVPWRLWQHSHMGRIEGVNSDIDINTFNGSPQQLQQWCAR